MKTIKNKADYERVLAEVERLMAEDPSPNSEEGDRLHILTLLIQDYEAEKWPKSLPSPVEAIKFRMEQEDLTPRDLIPFLGSRSRVSEILSGSRPLTLAMIRALHAGLDIPAEVLLQNSSEEDLAEAEIEWDRFPLREMVTRHYIKGTLAEIKMRAEDLVRKFFAPLGDPFAATVLCRKTEYIRSARTMDPYALAAWSAQVLRLAKDSPPATKFEKGTITLDFMQEVARLSWSDRGPILAQEFLGKSGIALVIEPHLPRTYLDGAAIMYFKDMPVIGMTIRHDRLDNFWFTLMHELAHISLHYGKEIVHFFDDLDVTKHEDARERDADELASEALIPEKLWEASAAARLRAPNAAQSLARKLNIHPAIVAGRMRREFNAYRLLSGMIGNRQVRKCFPDVRFPE